MWGLTCDNEYIGKTSRTFGQRFKEHLKESSHLHHHGINTGHTTTQHNFQIMGREDHGIARTTKESIYIRVSNPTLNRNIGKFSLHHIWDRVLLNTPGPKVKGHVQALGHAQSTQPNTPTPLNQSNTPNPIPLSLPNTPMQFFTGSMEHALRTPLSEHIHRTT